METSNKVILAYVKNGLGPSISNKNGYKLIVAFGAGVTIPESAIENATPGRTNYYPSPPESQPVIPFNEANLPSFTDPLILTIWSDFLQSAQTVHLWYTKENAKTDRSWGYYLNYNSSEQFDATVHVGESFGGWNASGYQPIVLKINADDGGMLIVGTLEIDP